ncbi:ArsR family transcriptional regulator [Arthrobacter sp. SPG23]|uniref:ArsR/SmtB family transcription factor n=1 Tax=Arthrobacter sp. SPG23 TaxID=1610703 RepID=UPI0005BCB5FC|nr:metalloregulator ArsR/SmtB family transcription factor [Arthrobacter sp. SPG23]KIS26381.1 ArsR family transcriptional regulator [Arthrobacter sp. SPG23]
MVTDDVFAVIAEATRRDILVSLRSGDKAVGELVEELDASQPTISKHLKVLREADLVSMRAQGQKRYYALNPKPLAGVASWLETFDVGPRAAVVSSPAAQILEEKPVQMAETAGAAPSPLAAAAGAARPAAAVVPGASEGGQLSPAVAIPVATAGDDSVPQQIGRTVGRAATKAADLIANLPKFGRKK